MSDWKVQKKEPHRLCDPEMTDKRCMNGKRWILLCFWKLRRRLGKERKDLEKKPERVLSEIRGRRALFLCEYSTAFRQEKEGTP